MRHLSLGLLAALAVVSAPASAAAAAEDVAFAGSGCTEVAVLTAIPAESARAVVPPPFKVVEAAGMATAGAAVLSCESLDVGGVASARTEISDTGIVIEDPSGSGGSHYYAVWQLTSSPALRDLVGEAGVEGALVDGLAVAASPVAPLLTHAHGSAPWSLSPFDLGVEVAGPAPSGASTASWWHRRGDDIIRLTYGIGAVDAHAGPGIISTTPGSRMAAVLGRDRAAGAGLQLDGFDFTAGVAHVTLP